MEGNLTDDFFDAYKETPISKTKKFCYKKVKKSAGNSITAETTSLSCHKNVDNEDSTTSKFFAKTVNGELKANIHLLKSLSSYNDGIEEQLNHIFNEVPESRTVGSTRHPELLQESVVSKLKVDLSKNVSQREPTSAFNKEVKSNDKSSNIAPLFLFKKKRDVSQKSQGKTTYCSNQDSKGIANNSLENTLTIKSKPKFQFKNKRSSSDLTIESKSVNNYQSVNKQSCKLPDPDTILNNSNSIRDRDYDSDNEFLVISESTKPLKLHLKNQIGKSQTQIVENERINKNETSNNKSFNKKKYSPSSDNILTSDLSTTVKSDITEGDSDKNFTDEFTSSPVIKPKKFLFKNKPTRVTSTLSPLIKQKLSDKNQSNTKKALSHISNIDITPEKSVLIEENTPLTISSSESFSKGEERQNDLSSTSLLKVTKNLFSEKLDDNITFVSQSLDATDADYMNDEEFEKLLHSGNDSNVFDKIGSGKTTIPLDEFNLNDIDWNEQFESEKFQSPNSRIDFDEVANMDLKDDSFSDVTFAAEDFSTTRVDNSKEFQGSYPFSEVTLEVLHQKFGLKCFRPRQKEIINASLNRHNCFVLMPTGGGKSLCYQLPAILCEGVTIVVSPLRALISDQVDKLNALDIPAAHLCSDVSKNEMTEVLAKLHMREPAIKLLYLTPEKIMASKILMDVLSSLYLRGKLTRFIIDEAHCLSQWGHDFRPDYKQLSVLKRKFKEVPIMCLTATATKQVEQDVINSLSLTNVKRFIMSFNRPNIKYQVISKTGGAIKEIIQLLNQKFRNKSGIIYCLTRKDCESVAQRLTSTGIKTKHYHAGISDKVREKVQREWMQDQFYVIVATIAFGMGIDKPDVRFVIHYSIPKSVEAFYQESGRAGRDGDISYSYLFYNYSDVIRLKKIIFMDRSTPKKTLDGHVENLLEMVAFAENIVDCRRHLQLLHLGENFDRTICIKNKQTTCDNCENFNKHNNIDVTKEAKELGELIEDLSRTSNVTLIYVADVYRGSKVKKILEKGHDAHKYYGSGQKMTNLHVHRILKDLIMKNILADHHTYTGEFPVVYIKPGPKFNSLNSSNLKITIAISIEDGNKTKKLNNDYPKLDIPMQSGPSTSTAKKRAPTKHQVSVIKVRCHEELLEECRRLALEKNVTLSSIMNLSAIKSMSEILPKTREEFLKIQHITVANYKKFGEFFLKITKKFAEEVKALQVEPEQLIRHNSHDDHDWSSLSQERGQGTKRKFTGGYQNGNKRYKRSYKRKPRKQKATKKTQSKKTSPKAKAKGGSLSLMPIHIK